MLSLLFRRRAFRLVHDNETAFAGHQNPPGKNASLPLVREVYVRTQNSGFVSGKRREREPPVELKDYYILLPVAPRAQNQRYAPPSPPFFSL